MEIIVKQGDITSISTEAIVNAANSSLLGGGGVDGAIHRRGGPAILEECRKISARQGGCPTGQAVITTGGNLPATYVIHTVGPVWQDGNQGEPEALRSCYRNSLLLAEENSIKTIAFPNISTGIYGYPRKPAAQVAIDEVKKYYSNTIEQVVFVCFDKDNYQLYQELLAN